MPRQRLVLLAVLAAIGLAGAGLALLAQQAGEVVVAQRADAIASDASASLDAGSGAAPDAAPSLDTPVQCVVPDLVIARDPRCESDPSYPACRWQLPADGEGVYEVWRNTTPDHRWARPGLVTLVMAAARAYQARWPGEHLTIGDLDAAGPRHQTHRNGVDVDLYLEHAMLDVNRGARDYVDNYVGRTPEDVAGLRARVMDLARILATCSGGRLRIYYNDPEIVTPFLAWFAAQGLVSDVGPAMTMHNRLHRFHFHMTVAEDLAPLGVGTTETTSGGTE